MSVMAGDDVYCQFLFKFRLFIVSMFFLSREMRCDE
jgi:hypothetical protein